MNGRKKGRKEGRKDIISFKKTQINIARSIPKTRNSYLVFTWISNQQQRGTRTYVILKRKMEINNTVSICIEWKKQAR